MTFEIFVFITGNDESKTLYMAGPGTAGSVTVSLHPLVIMNISEHWTRFVSYVLAKYPSTFLTLKQMSAT